MSAGWEQRWHPFRREWVVYAAHRNQRPWQGAAAPGVRPRPARDPACHLCPGNTRVGGAQNPDYRGVFVFDNDHPVVGPNAPAVGSPDDPIFRRTGARGLARVICFSPGHDRHFKDFSPEDAAAILRTLREETAELGRLPGVRSVLYFENRGEITGTSNPHPHGQLYAVNFLFRHIEQELEAVADFRREHGGDLFASWLDREQTDGARVILADDHALAVLPHFARYPYEVWILPRARRSRLAACTEEEIASFGRLYRRLCQGYDALYGSEFPYVCSLYEAPPAVNLADYRLHFTFLPPLRAPGLQKFPAGPEIGGGNFMNDTLPEDCARLLRAAMR